MVLLVLIAEDDADLARAVIGAERDVIDIVAPLLRRGLVPDQQVGAGIGEVLQRALAIGLAGALWLGRAASGFLFGVTATDPPTFAIVSLLLAAVAALACVLPARRAMKVEPVSALRQE